MALGRPAVLRMVHPTAIAAAAAAPPAYADEHGHGIADHVAPTDELAGRDHGLTRFGTCNHDDRRYHEIAPPPPS